MRKMTPQNQLSTITTKVNKTNAECSSYKAEGSQQVDLVQNYCHIATEPQTVNCCYHTKQCGHHVVDATEPAHTRWYDKLESRLNSAKIHWSVEWLYPTNKTKKSSELLSSCNLTHKSQSQHPKRTTTTTMTHKCCQLSTKQQLLNEGTKTSELQRKLEAFLSQIIHPTQSATKTNKIGWWSQQKGAKDMESW